MTYILTNECSYFGFNSQYVVLRVVVKHSCSRFADYHLVNAKLVKPDKKVKNFTKYSKQSEKQTTLSLTRLSFKFLILFSIYLYSASSVYCNFGFESNRRFTLLTLFNAHELFDLRNFLTFVYRHIFL